jgi:hypothetical protein
VLYGGFKSSFILVISGDGGVFSGYGSLEFSFNFFSEVGQHVFDLL